MQHRFSAAQAMPVGAPIRPASPRISCLEGNNSKYLFNQSALNGCNHHLVEGLVGHAGNVIEIRLQELNELASFNHLSKNKLLAFGEQQKVIVNFVLIATK